MTEDEARDDGCGHEKGCRHERARREPCQPADPMPARTAASETRPETDQQPAYDDEQRWQRNGDTRVFACCRRVQQGGSNQPDQEGDPPGNVVDPRSPETTEDAADPGDPTDAEPQDRGRDPNQYPTD